MCEDPCVIVGAHVVLYSEDAEADRAFLADVLGTRTVDAGDGWLILALPPAEVAVHPGNAPAGELYLMCDDLVAEIQALAGRGVVCSDIQHARWGRVTKIRLPSGGEIGLYQPAHPTAIADVGDGDVLTGP
jgi:catechol 2,3-dioxygenase-like lactoylglutathione lyase family enzyme